MPLSSERQFHMVQVAVASWAVRGHGDINYWKLNRNSWHNGVPAGFGLKSIVKIPVVKLTSSDCLDNFLKNSLASFFLFCIDRFIHSFIHSGTILDTEYYAMTKTVPLHLRSFHWWWGIKIIDICYNVWEWWLGWSLFCTVWSRKVFLGKRHFI